MPLTVAPAVLLLVALALLPRSAATVHDVRTWSAAYGFCKASTLQLRKELPLVSAVVGDELDFKFSLDGDVWSYPDATSFAKCDQSRATLVASGAEGGNCTRDAGADGGACERKSVGFRVRLPNAGPVFFACSNPHCQHGVKVRADVAAAAPGTAGTEAGRVCCMAMTASCLACTKGVSPAAYCKGAPSTDGCETITASATATAATAGKGGQGGPGETGARRDITVPFWTDDFGWCNGAAIRRPTGLTPIVAYEGDALVFQYSMKHNVWQANDESAFLTCDKNRMVQVADTAAGGGCANDASMDPLDVAPLLGAACIAESKGYRHTLVLGSNKGSSLPSGGTGGGTGGGAGGTVRGAEKQYFVCQIHDHCLNGQKLEVLVLPVGATGPVAGVGDGAGAGGAGGMVALAAISLAFLFVSVCVIVWLLRRLHRFKMPQGLAQAESALQRLASGRGSSSMPSSNLRSSSSSSSSGGSGSGSSSGNGGVEFAVVAVAEHDDLDTSISYEDGMGIACI